MRGKTSKRYRKLMSQFALHFGFREPYQVLVDSQIILDAARFTMELEPALERTLHGKTKPMITQCGFRNVHRLLNPQQQPHATSKDGEKKAGDKSRNGGENPQSFSREAGTRALETAKSFERRRCGHKPDEYPEPLSDLECIASCVEGSGKGKGAGENKHRYVVATQSVELRRALREVRGVPLMYIKRSVMILEPMAEESVAVGAKSERLKFKQGITSLAGAKRKREEDDDDDDSAGSDDEDHAEKRISNQADTDSKKKKKSYGQKGPNPLSIKKSRKSQDRSGPKKLIGAPEPKKRKRKPKAKAHAGTGATEGGDVAAPTAVMASADD